MDLASICVIRLICRSGKCLIGLTHVHICQTYCLTDRKEISTALGSYVKLSLAVVAILVGGLKCRKQFWKGTTQGSFQQSLFEIGVVVSEEKI